MQYKVPNIKNKLARHKHRIKLKSTSQCPKEFEKEDFNLIIFHNEGYRYSNCTVNMGSIWDGLLGQSAEPSANEYKTNVLMCNRITRIPLRVIYEDSFYLRDIFKA